MSEPEAVNLGSKVTFSMAVPVSMNFWIAGFVVPDITGYELDVFTWFTPTEGFVSEGWEGWEGWKGWEGWEGWESWKGGKGWKGWEGRERGAYVFVVG